MEGEPTGWRRQGNGRARRLRSAPSLGLYTSGQRRRWRRRLPRRSPRAQARRQAGGAGQRRGAPAWARRRAVYQSVVASSARAATARSMAADRRRASSPALGRRGAPKVTVAVGRRWPALALAQDAAGALEVDRHDRHAAAQRQVGGAARGTAGPSRRGCARPRGRSACDQPSSISCGRLVGRAAADLGALDRDGAEGEGGRAPSAGFGRSSRPRRRRRAGGATARGAT